MLTAYVFCLAVGGGLLALSFFGDFLEADVDLDADIDVEADVDAISTAPSPSAGATGGCGFVPEPPTRPRVRRRSARVSPLWWST